MQNQTLVFAAMFAALALPARAMQESPATAGQRLVVEPTTLELTVGDKAVLEARVVDAAGEAIDEQVFFFSRARRSVSIDGEGNVEALRPGTYTIVARTRGLRDDRLSFTVAVTVAPPPIARVSFTEPMNAVYAGTVTDIGAKAFDVEGNEREDPSFSWTTDDPDVAEIDRFGQLLAHAPGTVTLTVVAEGKGDARELRVLANPIARIALELDADDARTGDVVHAAAVGYDASGDRVAGVPILLSFLARPDDDLGSSATGQLEQDGRFVAEAPGLYTLVATSGAAQARATLRANARNVRRKVELIGRGKVHDSHTSDLWVFEGVDGRDYAVTGTWGANGEAHFWDVTDPSNIERIATVTVDARTVNDVKVSEDGRLCVISREGASNRRNGIVMFDVTDPSKPQELSAFDEELTGGVHNVYVADGHVYALSAGRRYDVIDVRDARSPRKVGSYELDTPGHSIHDVWVTDGIAYSSNWGDGIHLVDVGNGVAGGSPSNPVPIAQYAYPSGWNHAAFPWFSESADKFYVVGGDEAFPYGLHTEGKPTYPRGWLHFVDFTDGENPEEVARYQVPEAGSHNYWIEDDVCYAAFYNGGLRVIDVSGELLGDLYHQGREIAWFLPTDEEGYIANASMVWGPQPYKGHVFFSDWNTGLWCVKLVEEGR